MGSARGRLGLLWGGIALVVALGIGARFAFPPSAQADSTQPSSSSTDPIGAAAFAEAAGAPAGTVIGIPITDNICGGDWSSPGGVTDFVITNGGVNPADVYLEDPTTRGVYGELEGLAPRTSGVLSPTLGNGSYRLECFPADSDPQVGPTEQIASAGAVTGVSPGVRVVTQNEILPISTAYQKWVEAQLPTLLSDVDAIAAAASGGSTGGAKAAWLKAHLLYETLGAAYDAFGDVGDEIDDFEHDGGSAVADKELAGFHKIEALLWSGARTSDVVAAVDALAHAITTLQKQLPNNQLMPVQLPLRSHEIIENAIQFELTGKTDSGSHTNLATIGANIRGAQRALTVLTPLLTSRYPALPQTAAALAAAGALVASLDPTGWTALATLTRAQHEHLDADLGNALELLAPIAEIGDPRQEAGN